MRIAKNVAEALDYAHTRSVIHRDIKPANILLSETGEPSVSDFGIALAVSAGGADRLTETGLSLGTPHYMSPEQATGDLNVGPQTDIYALGCVLYEMLVGEPPFTGSTPQAVLGKIITGESPSARSERSSVPPNVDAVILNALEKLPADRFTRAQGFAEALGDPGFRHGQAVGEARGGPTLVRNRPALAFALLAAAFAFALLSSLQDDDPSRPIARFQSPFLDGQGPVGFGPHSFDLSSDGSTLVYMGRGPGDDFQLWVRRWDALEASPLPDTEGGLDPDFSPDGRRLAFEQRGRIMVAALEGGASQPVASGSRPHWGPDGQIYIRSSGDTIVRVPSTGGMPQPVVGPVEVSHIDFLPGQDVALLSVDGGEIHRVDLDSGEMSPLASGSQGQYAASGHLTFISDGALMAAPFDPESLELTGPPVSVMEGVLSYDVSREGDLVYTQEGWQAGDIDTELVWVSRRGSVSPAGWQFNRGGETNFYTLRLSPDGTIVALRAVTDGNADIWVKRLPGGAPRRLTYRESDERVPMWSDEGRVVTYLSGGDVWSVPASGTGESTLVHDGERPFREVTGSPRGDWLVLRTPSRVTASAAGQPERDLLALRPDVDTVARPLVATTQFAETSPALSDDGRWLAYSSTETGRFEVWVRPFPDVDADKVRISLSGGLNPRWSHSGDELFYKTPDDLLVAARIDRTSGFDVEARDTLFRLPPEVVSGRTSANFYDVSPDDRRFLMGRDIAPARESGRRTAYVLVQNFHEELKRLVPN